MSRRQAKKEKRIKKAHKVLKTILIILIIILVAIAGFVSYSTYKNGWGWSGIIATMMGHDSTTVEELGEFRILLMGVSTDISAKLTDTIIVASYNPQTQKATLLSIPRDTFVGNNKNNANSYDKINALYQKGPQKTLEAVNEITGLGIKYYAVIDTEALIKVVDAIGGVDFDVPIKMDYDDPTQNLHIHLKAGPQHINGEKAEQLLRFRHNNNGSSYSNEYGNNDIGRMRTQREFITIVAHQTIQLKNVLKINELLDIVYQYLETNVKLSSVKDYIPYALEFNTEDIQTEMLPGTSGMINNLSFYIHDKTKTDKLIKQLFYSEEEKDNKTSSSNSEISTVPISKTSKIKVELINCTGNSAKLTTVTNLLKKKGYNVSKTGTASVTSKTTIVDNTDVDREITNNIKDLLGVGNVSNAATTANNNADITIIIGSDYK